MAEADIGLSTFLYWCLKKNFLCAIKLCAVPVVWPRKLIMANPIYNITGIRLVRWVTFSSHKDPLTAVLLLFANVSDWKQLCFMLNQLPTGISWIDLIWFPNDVALHEYLSWSITTRKSLSYVIEAPNFRDHHTKWQNWLNGNCPLEASILGCIYRI